MSYMGIKDHCLALEKDGYLDTWRRPKPVGRPEMLYRLTDRARELFPGAYNPADRRGARSRPVHLRTGGARPRSCSASSAQRTEAYRVKIKFPELAEPVRKASRGLRDDEGYMSELGTRREWFLAGR